MGDPSQRPKVTLMPEELKHHKPGTRMVEKELNVYTNKNKQTGEGPAVQTPLEQVLPQLRSAGIVRSERGPSGGYRLNHPPEEITLDKVVRLFEGPLAPIPCATRHEPEPCPMDAGCSLRDVWADVSDATIRILEQTTFADLATRSSGAWTEIAAPTLARSNA